VEGDGRADELWRPACAAAHAATAAADGGREGARQSILGPVAGRGCVVVGLCPDYRGGRDRRV